MKLKFLAVAVALLTMTACGSKSDNEKDSKEKTKTEKAEYDDEDYRTSSDDYDSSSDYDTEDYDDDYSGSSVSSSDVDRMLDQYEEFVDNYVSLVKRAANGDMSAISSYERYMNSAEKLNEEIERCADSMNAAQTRRYYNITNKMSSALSDMSGMSVEMPDMDNIMEEAMGDFDF